MRRIAVFTFLLTLVPCLLSPVMVRAGISDTGVDTANGETLTTNPKTRKMTVTATVTDTIPPTIPILVAPSDTATVALARPTFIWKQSTDEQGIGKYQLWVDGSLLYDNIPITSTTNTSYTLVFEGGEYKLTPKSDLGQGSHTWYVKAFDVNNNTSISATWSFTVDTLGPLLIITNIGATTQNIRSDNTTTVPLTPIRLDANAPVIKGTGEVGTSVQMTLVIPGLANQTTIISLTTSANFIFSLSVLPVDTIVYASFTSSDSVGNTSVITNIPLLIQSATITLPLPSPTNIPIPRIEEVIALPSEKKRPPIIQKVIKEAPPLQSFLEAPLTAAIAEVAPVITFIAPVAVATAVATQTSFSILPIIFEIISRLLQSIGLIPVKRPRGAVFDTKSGRPVAFATLSFIRVSDNQIIDSVVSDTSGIYRSIKLPPGIYRIEAIHSEYLFPTQVHPKLMVNAHDFYRGENFEIRRGNDEQLFLIPMDPVVDTTTQIRHFYLHILLAYLKRTVARLFYPMVCFSLLITLFFPTWLNLAIMGMYAVMIGYRLLHARRQPRLYGMITDQQGKPVENALIRCSETGSNSVVALFASLPDGKFSIHLPPHKYALVINRDGYVVKQASLDYANVFIDHTGHEGSIAIQMETIQEAFPEQKM